MTVLDRPGAGARPHLVASPPGTGGEALPLPDRVLMKGNEAIAEAAIAAGCDAYFGYPITPQAELLEWMARRMPEEGRVYVQAESELAAINMALGASAAGARVLVSSSSPGISLMAEAMSYMAGSRLPVVLVNVMRGGPGLGSIGAAQGDYLQATKGHGHGDYRVPVLAPSSIAEAIDLVGDAFVLAERYRTPVILLADGILGQAMEPVAAGLPRAWSGPPAGLGARGRRRPGAPRHQVPAPAARGPGAARPRAPGDLRGDHGEGAALGRRVARRRRGRPRRLRHGGPHRPDGRGAGPGGRACGPGCSARSPCGRSPPRPCATPPATPAPCWPWRCRPASWSRTSGSRSRARSRCSTTAGWAAWCRPRTRSSTPCAAPGPPSDGGAS